MCFRGCSGTKMPTPSGLSPIEEYLVSTERKIGLSKVSFAVYRQAIKLYGYKGELTERQLAAVAKDINLDVSELADEKSEYSQVYKSEWLYDEDNFMVRPLLSLGFLLCNHPSEKAQVRSSEVLTNRTRSCSDRGGVDTAEPYARGNDRARPTRRLLQ